MRISDWSSDVCSSDLRKPDRKYPNYIDPYPGEKRQPYHSPPIDPDRRVWEEPGFDPRFKPKPDAEQRRLRAFVRTDFQPTPLGSKFRPILCGLDQWRAADQIGRAACGDRVGQYVSSRGFEAPLITTNIHYINVYSNNVKN